jgi:hypothetical protein
VFELTLVYVMGMVAAVLHSRLFYLWATPLFKLGFTRPLVMDDLWSLRYATILLNILMTVVSGYCSFAVIRRFQAF